MRALALALLLISGTAYADEVITGFDAQKDLPVLNEELRKLDEANQSLSSRIAVLEADTGTSAATQAQMEAATVTTVYASPGRTKYHPGVAKAWCYFDGQTVGTNAPTAGYNVTTVTRNGTGDYTLNLITSFSGTSYAVVGNSNRNDTSSDATIVFPVALTAGACQIRTVNTGGSLHDPSMVSVSLYGDQ